MDPRTLILTLFLLTVTNCYTDVTSLDDIKTHLQGTEENDQIEPEFEDVSTTTEEEEYFDVNKESTTLSMTDNDVYRIEDVAVSVNNGSNNIEVKETTTSMAATTRAMDDALADGQGSEEEVETPGQRVPKTENSVPKPPMEHHYKTLPPPTSKSSTLKGWLEDSWLRPPAGILVPLRPMALNRALAVWNDLTAEGLNVTDVVIVGYDSNEWHSNITTSHSLRQQLRAQHSKAVAPTARWKPLRPMALNRALAVWNDLTAEGLNDTDVVIVGSDSKGVNWRSRHNLQPSNTATGDRIVSEALSKLLMKYQGVNTDLTTDGTMRALTSAAKLVPYDSALFVVTDKGAGDSHRLPLALRALVEKRLKVYTIWTDPSHPSAGSEAELEVLKNISKHTEGEVLPYSLQIMDVDGSSNMATEPQEWERMEIQVDSRKGKAISAMEKLDTLLVRRGGGEAISLGVPVENGVTALRIYIEGLVEHAVLYPPNDAPQIDLYNVTSVHAFSPQSRTIGVSPRDIYLVFPGSDFDVDTLSVLPVHPTATASNTEAAVTVGVWHLSVRCDTCDYRMCVTARAHIHFHAEVEPKDLLKFRVIGPVASVRESVLIDEYGNELAKLPFSYQPTTTDGQEGAEGPPPELVADVALPAVKGSRVYAKIVGRDIRGEPFVRLSGPLMQEVRMGRSASLSTDAANDLERAESINSKAYQRLQYNDSNVLPFNRAVSQVVNQRGSLLTSVQIGLSTRLYGAPGDSLQLHFEVTNYREQAVRFNFEAQGELRFLTGINPTSQTIASGQTANVIVSVRITATAQPGARDLVTFTADGLERVSISAYVYVQNPSEQTTDVWAPELRHNFQGTCIGNMGTDCAQHVWSATIVARDALGGLLRLSSSPIGLVYDSNFISGTREEVVAIYRATCCAPRVVVTAIDAFGNANSYVIDISNYITGAGIAAIVLGVFLFIALIVLIVFLIYWCVRRRKESRELPYTTSTRNMS